MYINHSSHSVATIHILTVTNKLKMNKTKITPLLSAITIILILIVSCEKEQDAINYPQTYESESINNINLRVFTKDGEISDQSIVNSVKETYDEFLTDLDNPEIQGEIIVKYNSEDEIEIQEMNSADIDVRDVYNISGISYWEKRDTTETNGFLSEFERFLKYHPIYQEESYVTLTNNEYTLFKHCYYAKKEAHNISFPMIDFVVFGNSFFPNYPTQSASRINSEFDMNTISNLIENDTLIIQEYDIEMRQ
jgi:hypothetical protein